MCFIKIMSLVLVFGSLYFHRFASTEDSVSTSSSQEYREVEYTPCNSRHSKSLSRHNRATHRKQGVMVCITAKDSNVDVRDGQRGHKGKRKHHQDDDDDEDEDSTSTMEDEKPNRSEDEDDSDETVEDDSPDANHNHNDLINTNVNHHGHQHHNSGGRGGGSGVHSQKYPKGKRRKGKENFRIILDEQFTYRNWSSEWVNAKNPNNATKLFNHFSRVYARRTNHSRPNYGIITHNKGGEFYLIATTFPPFSTRNETLVAQFSVQFQSKAHCQLAFLRLYDCQFGTDDFGIQTPYVMQVGPHVCGTSRTNRVTAEFQEPGKTTIKRADKNLEPVNNTSVTVYGLALEHDGTYHIMVNSHAVQNGSLKDDFQVYRGYTGICGAGLIVWHSVLDKYFKGQIIIDDILVVNDIEYATKRRNQILKSVQSDYYSDYSK